jgi:hypothetical protein
VLDTQQIKNNIIAILHKTFGNENGYILIVYDQDFHIESHRKKMQEALTTEKKCKKH